MSGHNSFIKLFLEGKVGGRSQAELQLWFGQGKGFANIRNRIVDLLHNNVNVIVT